jgi:hypothetical protein
MRKLAFNLGLNDMDRSHYVGRFDRLKNAENDARAMAALARGAGYESTLVLTRNATTARLDTIYSTAARQLRAGDHLLVTYAGHGGQVDDPTGREEDGLNETLCLFDAEWTDDRTNSALAAFAPGVNVVLVHDNCHAKTVTRTRELFNSSDTYRALPMSTADATYLAHKKYYDGIAFSLLGRSRGGGGDIRCSVLTLSATEDDQLALDGRGSNNGLFTGLLLRVWNGGAFKGSYRDFIAAIAALVPRSAQQTPSMTLDGQGAEELASQRPFTPEIPMTSPGQTPSSTWTWGIPRTRGSSTRGALRGDTPPTVARGTARSYTADATPPGPARDRESMRMPAVTVALQQALAATRGGVSPGAAEEYLSGLGEPLIEGNRVIWEPPDGEVSPELVEYLRASVTELNNQLDAGVLFIDDSQEIRLVTDSVVPDGSYVTSVADPNRLYLVENEQRSLLTPDDVTRLGIAQSDVQVIDPLVLYGMPVATTRGVRDEPVFLASWSGHGLRAGQSMETWCWLQGTTLTTRTATHAYTWFIGWTSGVRINLYDSSGNLINFEPIKYRYGCDARAFGSGERDETEVLELPQEIADSVANILIAHYPDPKSNFVDNIIVAAQIIWEAIRIFLESQGSGEEVNAGIG